MRSESRELERIRPRTRMVEKPYSLTMLVEQLEEMLASSSVARTTVERKMQSAK
jgi:hypothetical protein